MTTPPSNKLFFYGLILYFSILLLLAPTNLLSLDTYYYWDWSRHLALSYYDGSPLIAYLIKLSTLLFGNTLFALTFVGIASTALTSLIIYKTARLFLTKEASYVALFLWLFSPLVTLDLLKQTTYDTPLNLFWALTLFCTTKFILSNKIRWLYMTGISIGLMMLSKYSGFVLVLSLFIFLLVTPLRALFRTCHLYLSMLISLIIFSPVLLWNYQHEWQSFIYQLTTHQLKNHITPLWGVVKAIYAHFLPALNFMLLPPILCWLNRDKLTHSNPVSAINPGNRVTQKIEKKTLIILLYWIISVTFIGFYILSASKALIREDWLSPYIISSAILAAVGFQTLHYRKSTFLLITIYALASLTILINNSPQFSLVTPQKLINYYLIQKFNTSFTQLPKVILTPGWAEARILFFLKGKPQIYTIECGVPQNQYALWSTEVNQSIKNKSLKEALFIDPENRVACAEKYFNQCVRLNTATYPYKNKEYALYAYRCTN